MSTTANRVDHCVEMMGVVADYWHGSVDAIRKTPASYHEDSCIISWGLMVRFISGKKISKRSPTCPHDIFITPHDMSGKNLHVKNIPPEMVQKTFFSIVMHVFTWDRLLFHELL